MLRRREVLQGNLVLSTELIISELATVLKRIRKLTFRLRSLECFSTGLFLSFKHTSGRIRNKNSGLVMSPEILNPEFEVGTLNPKTFETGEFCRVNDFLSNSDIVSPAKL